MRLRKVKLCVDFARFAIYGKYGYAFRQHLLKHEDEYCVHFKLMRLQYEKEFGDIPQKRVIFATKWSKIAQELRKNKK